MASTPRISPYVSVGATVGRVDTGLTARQYIMIKNVGDVVVYLLPRLASAIVPATIDRGYPLEQGDVYGPLPWGETTAIDAACPQGSSHLYVEEGGN